MVYADVEFILDLYEIFRLGHPWHETNVTLESYLQLNVLVIVSPSHRCVGAIIKGQ